MSGEYVTECDELMTNLPTGSLSSSCATVHARSEIKRINDEVQFSHAIFILSSEFYEHRRLMQCSILLYW